MRFGRHVVYVCPNCGQIYWNKTLMSGNTLRRRFYSDLKTVYPMLIELPNLIKCDKCGLFIKLLEQDKVGEFSGLDDRKELPWKNMIEARFPTVYEYVEYLSNLKDLRKKEEYAIRRKIWLSFNDRIRDDCFAGLFSHEADKYLWEDNLNKLLELIEFSAELPMNYVLVSEIHRYMGDFETAFGLLYCNNNPEIERLRIFYESKIEAKDRRVFLIPEEE